MKQSERREANRVWKRKEIESPCVNVCLMHPRERICTGCHRTVDEITRWSSMSAEERQAISDELSDRAPRLNKRRGGRSERLRSQN